MANPPRVLIVDDHVLVRRGLRDLFEESAGFAVCGEATTVAEALEVAEQLQPALVTVDLGLEGRGGLDLIAQLRRRDPALPVLVVSMWDEQLYAGRALRAGARGYVTKGRASETVLEAARQVLAGETYVSEDARAAIGEAAIGEAAIGEAAIGEAALDALSDREMEIFLLIGQGHAPRSIAEQLHLSVSTVESYRQHLKQKLQLDSAAMLRRYATDWVRGHL